MSINDKILAQGNVIGSLVMALMDSDQPDVEAVLQDFRHCLSDYDSWAERFWTGRALDIEQMFKVGNEVSLAPAKNGGKQVSAVVAACPAQGPLTLVHMFQSSRFVPIGNTPVMEGNFRRADPPRDRAERHPGSQRMRPRKALPHHLFS
jgi:hypothetical protein